MSIIERFELGAPPWTTFDPFLFCVHHRDEYPEGNADFGPSASLAGRQIGMDFSGKEGWSMYHGDVVPGFPRHPHRGFETISIVRDGYVDHSDSLGATGRLAAGDVQWMTAGKGIEHSEMFPLVHEDAANPTELFQLWINLEAASKMVEPDFTMLWAEEIPILEDSGVRVQIVAGALAGQTPAPPPAPSYAAREDAEVCVWIFELAAGARFALPPARKGSNRTLYFFRGQGLRVAGQAIDGHCGLRLQAEVETILEAEETLELMVLGGKPIGEPVAHYGPFVMNTEAEIRQAISDYHRTQYGRWPWPSNDPHHGRSAGRFAVHASGYREER